MLKLLRKHTTDQSDEDLVSLYQSTGDVAHLGILFERYVELVHGTCLKYYKDQTKAEDAVMGIFETLIEKVKTHEIRQFRPWLHVLSKNYCLMQLRKKNFTVSFDDLPLTNQAELVQSAGPVHPLDDLDEKSSMDALKDCMEQLSEQQRQCVEQFYFENKSYKDIAAESGEELGMVRSNIQNGRRNLRICMEKKGVMSGSEKEV